MLIFKYSNEETEENNNEHDNDNDDGNDDDDDEQNADLEENDAIDDATRALISTRRLWRPKSQQSLFALFTISKIMYFLVHDLDTSNLPIEYEATPAIVEIIRQLIHLATTAIFSKQVCLFFENLDRFQISQ